MEPRDQVIVSGIAEIGPRQVEDRTPLQLCADAALQALEDAGLSPADVDGLLTPSPTSQPHHMFATMVSEHLGLRPSFCATIEMGGATPHANVVHAALAILAGVCETVLIVDADSRQSRYQGDKAMAMKTHNVGLGEFEEPYGPIVPGEYALLAQRHMYEYGTTSEQLAEIAVAERYHAGLNPLAEKQAPITVEDVLASPVIGSPLHLLDCCLVSDWGAALVLRHARHAGAGRRPPVFLSGFGEAHGVYQVHQLPSLTATPVRDSAARAFRMAGLGPGDVDVAEIYDSFTVTVLLALEDLGFCPKGEGGRFVEHGGIRLGGRLPVNTHGGQLSCCGSHSFFLTEAVRQLRGEAGRRQVEGARVALSQGTAADMSSSYTLLLRG